MNGRGQESPGPRDDGRARMLVTAEGIALPVRVASRGARVGALVFDLMLIFGLMLVFTLALLYLAFGVAGLSWNGGTAGQPTAALEFLAVVWIILMFLFRNAYFLLFELGPRGATPGKRVAGIRIASRGAGRLKAEAVIARNLLRDIELFLPLVFIAGAQSGDGGLAGYAAAAWFALFLLFPFFNKDALRAGDLVAGTWVVEAPRAKLLPILATDARPDASASARAHPAYRFSDEELAVYGEYELQTLENLLRHGRGEARQAVAATIRRKIGRAEEEEGDENAFLEAYYAQLRARLERGMRFGNRKADKHS